MLYFNSKQTSLYNKEINMTLIKDNKVLTSENLYEYLGITGPTWAGVDFEFKFEDDLYTVIIDPNSSHPYYYTFKITTPAIDDWHMPDTLMFGTIEDNLRRYKTIIIALKTFQNLQENLKHLNSPFGAHYDNDTVDVTFDGTDYTIKVANHGAVMYKALDDEGQVVELGKSDSPEVVADKITDLILQ